MKSALSYMSIMQFLAISRSFPSLLSPVGVEVNMPPDDEINKFLAKYDNKVTQKEMRDYCRDLFNEAVAEAEAAKKKKKLIINLSLTSVTKHSWLVYSELSNLPSLLLILKFHV